jgi:hypothetical protein
VRRTGVSRAVATDRTWSTVTASMRSRSVGTTRQLAIVSKWPSWCAMLVTLSPSNTSRARSCVFARSISCGVTPACRTRSIVSSVASSTVRSGVPSVAVIETV